MTTDQPRAATVTTPTDVEIRAERVFDAPRDMVYATFVDPALIPEWWGGNTAVDQMDVREGGTWRFVGQNPDGSEMVFRGDYLEVSPPERVVQTFEREGWPGRHVQTFEFEDLGSQTKLVTTLRFDTAEERDNLLEYGGEAGMNETYARLDSLLAKLAAS